MNGNSSLPNYEDLLAGFRRSDAQRDELVAEIIKCYEQLKADYETKCDDLSNEIEARRMWQSKARASESALTEERQVSGSNPFVLAIIDGDGAIFQDNLLAMGKDGGADAAYALQVEIRNQLRTMYPEGGVGDWNIVVHVILNLQGLAMKLQSCGMILDPKDLAAFGRQFGLTQPLFNFIDVGAGKERADHKIREMLRLYLPIPSCKHIFFGPCNDNGYLPVLEQFKKDPAMKDRLALVETRPAEPGFVDLGFRRVRFPRIFRTEDLPSAYSPFNTHARLNGAHFGLSERTNLPDRSNLNSKPMAPIAPPGFNSTPPSRAPSADSSISASASTWATVGKSAAGGKIDIAPKKAKAAPRKFIQLNAYDGRLDQDLPRTDPSAEHRFAERVKVKGKLCNNFHLGGKCPSTDSYCDYHHGDRLTPGEQLVLKHKARSLHCPNKFGCRDFNCFLGHHCKFGSSCSLDYCRFADTHDAELEPAKKFYEDESEEWLSSYLNTVRE